MEKLYNVKELMGILSKFNLASENMLWKLTTAA